MGTSKNAFSALTVWWCLLLNDCTI